MNAPSHAGTRTVVVGSSQGLGYAIAQRMVQRGRDVVVTSRDPDRAAQIAEQLGERALGLAVDLSRPAEIEAALAPITDRIDGLVITAIEQTVADVAHLDVDEAARAITTKLVGYPEVVRVLHPRFTESASVVLFGGLAKERPYPGSTLVTTFNNGVTGLVKTLAVELAPTRVNALHPGVVGDTPRWRGVDHPHRGRAPIGRLVVTDEIVHATEFLLENSAINGHDLYIDGGLLAT